jgi:hypothetical protein
MNPKFTVVSAEELFVTKIGVTGTPISSNAPGRKFPYLKYIITGGILLTIGIIAYKIAKQKTSKIKFKKNE